MHADVVEKIVHLRRKLPSRAPTKISMYLKRYHDVAVSSSGVWRIIKRLGLNRLPASRLGRLRGAVGATAEVIQTDNGTEFQSAFHWHVLDKGIGHVYIKPATPRLNGKVERSHRIDAEEFYRLLDGVVIDDAKVFNGKL